MNDTNYQHGCEDGERGGHRYEWSAGTPLSIAVIEAVATVANCDPAELDPLNEYVDPDALDALFDHRDGAERSSKTVSFPFGDYHVVVDADREIRVRSRESSRSD